MQQLTEFFEAPIEDVNRLCYWIALLHGEPDWLRGKPSFRDLPRLSTIEQQITVRAFVRDRSLADRIFWIVENLEGPWSFTTAGFGFETAEEAVMFTLRFPPR